MPFWRIHSVHHSDENVTAVSSLLQHPLGVLLSGGIHLFFAVLLGLPLLVFIIYGFFAVVHGVFTHADIRLPGRLDEMLRKIIVTPDLHRTHHSIDMQEGNSNFGVVFTFWDRLFGTYVKQPKTGVPDLVMGLPSSESPRRFTPAGLFLHPFRRRG
jgi:sterol desaturase/sphingolipid hydroxylase (fatty acid hydroxylase superfamily)